MNINKILILALLLSPNITQSMDRKRERTDDSTQKQMPPAKKVQQSFAVFHSGRETFELTVTELKKLFFYSIPEHIEEALSRETYLPFQITNKAGVLFKELLTLKNKHSVDLFLKPLNNEQIVSLIWLLDFFSNQKEAKILTTFLAKKAIQHEFLRTYKATPILIPASLDQSFKNILLSAIHMHELSMLQTLPTLPANITAIALNAQNKLITSSQDGLIRIFDLNTSECIKTLQGCIPTDKTVLFLQSTKPGRLTIVFSDGTVSEWDINTNTNIQTLNYAVGYINSALIAHNALITGDAMGIIQVWNRTSDAPPKRLSGNITATTAMMISPNNKLIVSFSDGLVQIWDIVNNRIIKNIYTHIPSINSLALTVDDKIISATNFFTYAIDLETNHIQAEQKLPQQIQHLIITPDGKFVTVSNNRTIHVWGANIPKLDSLSIEQLLLILKLTQTNVTQRQLNTIKTQELFQSLPEATHAWLSQI